MEASAHARECPREYVKCGFIDLEHEDAEGCLYGCAARASTNTDPSAISDRGRVQTAKRSSTQCVRRNTR